MSLYMDSILLTLENLYVEMEGKLAHFILPIQLKQFNEIRFWITKNWYKHYVWYKAESYGPNGIQRYNLILHQIPKNQCKSSLYINPEQLSEIEEPITILNIIKSRTNLLNEDFMTKWFQTEPFCSRSNMSKQITRSFSLSLIQNS